MCFILATRSADHPPVMSTLIQSHTRHPHWLSPLMTVSMRRGPSLPVTYSSSTGVSAVAGDYSLSRPLHQNHHPLEWPPVATEAHPHAQTATVSAWIDAGSRAPRRTRIMAPPTASNTWPSRVTVVALHGQVQAAKRASRTLTCRTHAVSDLRPVIVTQMYGTSVNVVGCRS